MAFQWLRKLRLPLVFNGISKQPPIERLPNQVNTANNVNFSVVDGMTRRPGSFIQQYIHPGLLPAGNNRLHEIVRDQNERYLLIHNRTTLGAILRILELSTNLWADITISSVAQAYLNSGSPDDFRIRTLLDTTLVLNTTVRTGGIDKLGQIQGYNSPFPGFITVSSLAHGFTAGWAFFTAVASATTTDPAKITSLAHGLSTGMRVTIFYSDSIPPVDGSWYITVLDADTFTIPTVVNGAGTTGVWTRGQSIVIQDSVPVVGPSIDGGPYPVLVQDANTFLIPFLITVSGTSANWTYGSIDPTKMPMQLVRQNTSATGTITANTLANPTIVTSAAHGLVTGQTVHITGSNSTPSIDGAYPVIVLGVDTFSIAVNVTVAGTSGTWVAAAYFTLGPIFWDQRGSNVTRNNIAINPVPAIWKQGRKIFDVRYWRGRLVILSEQGGILTQAQNLFNIWIVNVIAIADADPIPFSLSSEQNVVIDYAVPIHESMILFTKAGKQFLLGSGGAALSLSTLRCDPITRYRTLPAEPMVMDPAVYYGINVGGNVHLSEYFYDDVSAPNTSEDVSLHVADLIPLLVNIPPGYSGTSAEPSSLQKIAVCPEEGFVFLLRRDRVVNGELFGTNIFVYRTRYVGTKKVQIAWTTWQLSGIRGIHDICVIGTYLYALVHCGTNSPPDFFVIRINIPLETSQDTVPNPTS